MSINKYLNTLGLQPGVSEKEIKSAYRRLAKKYHPDVSPGEESRQKFIEINEAYNFLINVGPTPQNEAVNYGYNPSDIRDFEARRDWARAKAEEMEREARKELGIFLRKANRIVSYFSMIVLALHVLFLFDVQSQMDRNKIESYFFIPLNQFGAPITQPGDFQIAEWNLDSFTVYERFSNTFISQPDNIWIYQTPVFNKLMHVEFDKNGETKLMDNPAVAYNMIIFKVIVIVSTITILITLATPYYSANKVTLSIIILFLAAIEGFIFILN